MHTDYDPDRDKIKPNVWDKIKPKGCDLCRRDYAFKTVVHEGRFIHMCKKCMNMRRPRLVSNNIPRRNEPCPCGSGKKFKKCCLRKTMYE